MDVFIRFAFAWLLAVSLFCLSAQAQEVRPQDEYMKRLKVYQTIQPLGDAPFGENVNLYTGELSFSQTDITLEGTGPAIVLTRETTTVQTRDTRTQPNAFHDWTLNIPRIESLMPMLTIRTTPGMDPVVSTPGSYWKTQTVANDTVGTVARCTYFGLPVKKGTFVLDDWWQGYELITPTGRQQLLKRVPENTQVPATGGPYPAVTQQNWQLGCLPATSNGQPGEGFLAISPSGERYYLDHLVGERAAGIVQEVPPDGRFYLQRMLGTLYVSRVEDRVGNWVKYHYCPPPAYGNACGDLSGKLHRIEASDGRLVDLTWRGDARVVDHITVQAASTSPRTWQYEYVSEILSGVTRYKLSAVVQPDGGRWTFNLADLGGNVTPESFNDCASGGSHAQATGGLTTSTLTHPSGLVGTFGTTATWHGRSYVESACLQQSADTLPYEAIPAIYGTLALRQKQFSGPGIPTRTWTYTYPDAQYTTVQHPCAAAGTCVETKTVAVTDPEGDVTRYTHSTRWGAGEGKLLSTEVYEGSTQLLRRDDQSYAASSAGPYPSRIGDSMQGWRSNLAKSETWTPLRQSTTTQEGRRFIWQVAGNCVANAAYCFDQQARPTKVIKTSEPAP